MGKAKGSMRRTGAWVGASLLWLVACTEEPTGPSSADFNKSRAAVAERTKAAAKPAPKLTGRAEPGKAGGSSFASDRDFSYDRAGKRDPFRSFEWERLVAEQADTRGPLEQFDVAQLSLVAVIWNAGRPRAMVRDPAGHTYIVAPGTRIGKNLGRVMTIGDSAVRVEETYVDLSGQETTKEIELSIRRSQGG